MRRRLIAPLLLAAATTAQADEGMAPAGRPAAMIGTVGSQLGAAGINIVNFALGAAGDGQARAAITVDQPLDDAQLATLRATPGVLSLQQV